MTRKSNNTALNSLARNQHPTNAEDVVPNDTTDLTNYGLLRIGSAGTVKVDLEESGTITYTLNDGDWLPVRVKRVYTTGTTATDIVVHY